MVKKIILAIMLIVTITTKAQYYIMPSKVMLPSIDLDDILLKEQLDSILFIKHPCEQTSYKVEKEYTYFMWIKEDTINNYSIDIVFAKPSEVENEVNTGVYKTGDIEIVIREDSKVPLFRLTGDKDSFSYNKELVKSHGNILSEILSPEEYCIWGLYYSDKKLKIIDLERVKNASM